MSRKIFRIYTKTFGGKTWKNLHSGFPGKFSTKKNLIKYYVKFPAKRYSYIISKKNLVVIFLSWYLHQFCQTLSEYFGLRFITREYFKSLKRKSIMARQRYWFMVQSEFIVEIMNCFWCFDEIQPFFFLHKTCHAYDALSLFKIFKAVSFQM